MNHKLCIVIPLYNHAREIFNTVAAVKPFGMPCIIVNDGSNAETVEALNKIVKREKWVSVVHRVANGGKGAAVKDGFRAAHAAGYTHVLQIDADGQHESQDIHRFLKLLAENPDAMIAGEPVFDDSIPKSRLYGRYITRFWVWVETLSFSIKDAMCGFRLYRLQEIMPLLKGNQLGDRMDFDIQILVRLYWKGVRIVPLPTKVIYPQGGTSHFKAFKDNVLISWAHTRLCFGMLLRLPVLLFRKLRPRKDVHWSSKSERGISWGIRFLIFIYRIFGKPVFYAIFLPVIVYFFLTGSEARQASRAFLARVYEYRGAGGALDKKPGLLQSLRHFLEFGRSTLDKISAWMGRLDHGHLNWPNRQDFVKLAKSKHGGVILGAHLGNLEMLRALAEEVPEVKLNVLVITRHAANFNNFLKKVNPNVALELIQAEEMMPDTIIYLQNKVAAGELVVALADRTSVGSIARVSNLDFLGRKAPFPHGPFVLASLLECPVYTIFCMRNGAVYDIHFQPLAKTLRATRKERIRVIEAALAEFAKRLEKYALAYPFQWFNFFDFWRPAAKEQDG